MTADKPLKGVRVLVPRGGKWGDGVAASLRSRGAAPVIAPLINFAPAETPELLAAALARLESGVYEWLVVTSATTVDVLVGNGIRPPASTRVAAVGETTAAALSLAGIRVDFVPEGDNSARGLVKEWPADEKIFTDPVLEPMFEAEFDAAFAQGGVGALDDMWAFPDWGFTPEEVTQHVELFVGDADDILDPEMSNRLTKRLPDCTQHIWPGAGHYGVYGRWEEFLGALV